jgi:hypothetical protein
MQRILLVAVSILLVGTVAHAQIAVHDAAVTARNRVTAALEEYQLQVQQLQNSQLRRMAQRLSLFTNLHKYALPEVPRWRTHDFESADVFPFARAFHAALNYGDPSGAAFFDVSQPVLDAVAGLARLPTAARRSLLAALATLDIGGAAVVSAAHDSGRVRYNGRQELRAIDDLERDVTDGSLEQSTAAVLDKISGSVLIAARQRQARTQLLSAVVEQLLVESKRARDTEAAAMNMQFVAWRARQAVNTAFANGSGDALRTWRQP